MCFSSILIYIFIYYRKEPPSGRVVALLVEEFETFMKQRPGFVEDSGSEVRKKKLSKNLFLLYSAVNRVMYFINWLFFLQLHNEEVRAFIDKVATMLTAKYPESVKNIVEKFSPSKGQKNQKLVNELKWKEFYKFSQR